jgi:diadenosine tetraphosphatase ApaH/serine/threonine PP2A family protein phosphatase
MKYAILSDIHANYEALTAVLNKCAEIGVTDFISLGDIVGYNANPKECLDLMRSLNLIAAVKGNHDEYVSNNDEVMEGFNPHARAAVLWTKAQLSEEDRAWLAGLPMRLTVRGTTVTIVHATLDSPDTWGYIFDLHQATDNFTYQFTQLCFCGHSHVPLAFCKKPVALRAAKPIDEIPAWSGTDMDKIGEETITLNIEAGYRYLINVGSVGQPRNRDPRASFAVYDSDAKTVTRYRSPYDLRTTQEKILQAGLPEHLANRLENGK